MNSREEWGTYEVPELTVRERYRRKRLLEKDEDQEPNGDDEGLLGNTGLGRGKRVGQFLSSSVRNKKRKLKHRPTATPTTDPELPCPESPLVVRSPYQCLVRRGKSP